MASIKKLERSQTNYCVGDDVNFLADGKALVCSE
jgi:hypothetical protein